MAVIKTSNTYSLAESLVWSLTPSFEDATEALEEIDFLIETKEDNMYQDGTYEEDGGTVTNTLTETSTRTELTTTFKNFPNDEEYLGDGRENGTENIYLTGNNLTTSLLNSTGFGWSESADVEGNDWEETDNETATGKHRYEDGTLIVTDFNLKETETGKYNEDSEPSSWSESTTYNFAGEATYNDDTFSIKANTFKSLEKWTEKGPDGNGAGNERLELSSQNGVSYDFSYDYFYDEYYDEWYRSIDEGFFSGIINSITFSDKGTETEDGEPHSWDDFYQSTSALDASLLNDSFEAFYEALLAGDDKITGTSKEGNDLYGGAGNDTVKGGTGNDSLNGGEGNDILDGGAGDDYLSGGNSNDTVKGGAGADAVYGDAGSDTLDGGAGNDLLIGSTGTDTLKGSAGADTFVFFNGDSNLTQSVADTTRDFKIKQNDKLAFDFDFGDDDIVIQLGKSDKTLYATYNDLLTAANQSEAKIFVGYTAADKKNGYVFTDHNGGGMDMAIKLTGVTSTSKIDAQSFINVSDAGLPT